MILIADSGSTKTDWRLIDDKKNIHQFRTAGLNPYFLNADQISEIIQHELKLETDKNNIKEIYFYGAGCSGKEKCDEVAVALRAIFSKATIEVQHDLLAACRSLCGREKGIVSILGTGSNSCFYDGEKIIDQVPSLGFILGDEGSGAHLGKKLVQSYFYRELPDDLAKRFEGKFHLTKEEVLETVYRKPLPNQFLASFTHFIFQNRNETFFVKMVYDCFSEFFSRHICKYENYQKQKIHCTGSVGFYFADTFRQVASERGIQVGKIIESPIAGLTLYHLNEKE